MAPNGAAVAANAAAVAAPPGPSVRGAPVRRLLALLTLSLALPLVALAGVSAWSAMERERARFEEQLVQTSRALALGVDREFAQARAILHALAASSYAAEGDLLRLDAQARAAVPPQVFAVAVFDARGNQLMNTGLPPGRSLLDNPPQTNQALIDEVLAAGETRLSDVFVGSSGRHVVAVSRPVEMNGERVLLTVAIPARRMGDVLREQQMPERWVAAVLDRRLVVAARTRAEESFVGQRATRPVVELFGRADGGVIRNIPTHDGMPAVVAMSRAPQSGFAVVMAAPVPSAWGELGRVLALPLAAGSALLALGLLAARGLGTRLARGIAALAPGAAPAASGIRELDGAAARLREAERARDESARALADSEERYRVASEAFAGGIYECRPLEGRVIRSQGLLRVLGEERDEPRRDWWFSRVHPDDLPGLLASYASAKEGGAPGFETEYRIRHRDGHFRWIWHRSVASRDAAGRVVRMIGSLVDITAEREAREAESLVSRELDHRVKNTFALVGSIAGLTASRHPEAAEYAAEFRERLAALAAAHDVLRRGASEASLHALLRRLAAPYGEGRVSVLGQDAALAAEAVPQLALILHEWLTNAAKYGALSERAGRVSVTTSRTNGSLVLRWVESGGPLVEGPPEERGFGSLMAEATAGSRFGGALEEEWNPAGLRLTLRLAADRVLAPQPEAAAATGPSTLSR